MIANLPYIKINDRQYGGLKPLIIAGPCAVEPDQDLLELGYAVKQSGAHFFRGGAYKPRTSASAFQGLGEKGLQRLSAVKKKYDLPIVSEITDADQLTLFKEYNIDVLQIGTRNMQNYELLKKIAQNISPDNVVMLKRGFSATKEEVAGALGYLTGYGIAEDRIILCGRGIKSFSNYARSSLEIPFFATERLIYHPNLFLIGDPSHSAGGIPSTAYNGEEYDKKQFAFIRLHALGCIGAGAQGVMIDVIDDSVDRKSILVDGQQAIRVKYLRQLIEDIHSVYTIVNR